MDKQLNEITVKYELFSHNRDVEKESIGHLGNKKLYKSVKNSV